MIQQEPEDNFLGFFLDCVSVQSRGCLQVLVSSKNMRPSNAFFVVHG